MKAWNARAAHAFSKTHPSVQKRTRGPRVPTGADAPFPMERAALRRRRRFPRAARPFLLKMGRRRESRTTPRSSLHFGGALTRRGCSHGTLLPCGGWLCNHAERAPQRSGAATGRGGGDARPACPLCMRDVTSKFLRGLRVSRHTGRARPLVPTWNGAATASRPYHFFHGGRARPRVAIIP